MISDPGERYIDTYFNPVWLSGEGIDIPPFLDQLEYFFETGHFTDNFFLADQCYPQR